jgi:hypothetical protein
MKLDTNSQQTHAVKLKGRREEKLRPLSKLNVTHVDARVKCSDSSPPRQLVPGGAVGPYTRRAGIRDSALTRLRTPVIERRCVTGLPSPSSSHAPQLKGGHDAQAPADLNVCK